jgi:hypothetical protein
MTRLVALQHLQREGPGLFALEATPCRGWSPATSCWCWAGRWGWRT